MADENVKINKIKPYPIEVRLVLGPDTVKAEIVKLTEIGILVDIGSNIVNVGSNYECQFVIPVYKTFVKSEIKTIKTYDHYAGSAGDSSSKRIAEFHFLNCPDEYLKAIYRFMRAIGQ